MATVVTLASIYLFGVPHWPGTVLRAMSIFMTVL